MKKGHTQFAGIIPENYETYIGPLFFEPYALDLMKRIDFTKTKMALEIACGTGRVTRHLAQHLQEDATLIATDLNAGMLRIAQQKIAKSTVQFKEADAQQLPFEDGSSDLVVCQFGFMFVPDKEQAFKEAYRVLKQDGVLLFNTWDSLEHNQLTLTIKNIVAQYAGTKAADFYKLPFSFYNQQKIASLLKNAGFRDIHIEAVSETVVDVSPEEAARGLILGTPAFNIIAAEDEHAPERLVAIAAGQLANEFGNNRMKTELNALVCKCVK